MQLFGTIILVLIIKILLVFVSQTTDPDAVVRIFQSLDWKDNPHWIGNNVWGPFNYYLTGIGLLIYDDVVFTPKLINVILSVLVVLPTYALVRIKNSHHVALITTMVFLLSPLVFRNSLMAMTETPYILLLSFCTWKLMSFFQFERSRDLIIAGLCITLAAGFRYEAWALMFAFWLMLLLNKKIKGSFYFAITAGLFPVIWLISNHIYTGDFLWSLKGNNHWTLEVMKTNEHVSAEEWFRRVWFIPFMFYISLGPVFSLSFLKGSLQKETKFWMVPFGFISVLLLYKSINGTLLHHPRFAITLLFLSLPFVANGVKLIFEKVRSQLVLGIAFILMVGGSFVYNVDRIEPVPLLTNQSSVQTLNLMHRMKGDKDVVLIDFIGWEETYFYALRLKKIFTEVIIVGGYDSADDVKSKFQKMMNEPGEKWVVSYKFGTKNQAGLVRLKFVQNVDDIKESLVNGH